MKKLIIILSLGFLLSSCKKEEEIIIQNNCCHHQDSTKEVKYLHYKTKLIYNDPDSNKIIYLENEQYFVGHNYFYFKNNLPTRIWIDFEEGVPFHDVIQNYNDSIFYPPLNCKTKIWLSPDGSEIQIIATNPGHKYLFDKKRIIFLKRIDE